MNLISGQTSDHSHLSTLYNSTDYIVFLALVNSFCNLGDLSSQLFNLLFFPFQQFPIRLNLLRHNPLINLVYLTVQLDSLSQELSDNLLPFTNFCVDSQSLSFFAFQKFWVSFCCFFLVHLCFESRITPLFHPTVKYRHADHCSQKEGPFYDQIRRIERLGQRLEGRHYPVRSKPGPFQYHTPGIIFSHMAGFPTI